jgi:ribosomal-protein-alanine N-acetyltransferase
MKTILETPRFILREITMDDIDGLFLLESNPAVYKYLSIFDPVTGENLYPPVSDKSQIIPLVEKLQKQYRETGMGRWAIISKETNDFVGWCGLKIETEIRKPQIYNDIGYRLREEYWGQGIATETAKACLDYGYNTLKLDSIAACAVKTNLASDRVLHKIGLKRIEDFVFEGVDCWYYSI